MKEYKIKVKDHIVDVSEEVYTTYYKMRRREKYLEEVCVKKNLSYNHLVELDYPVEERMCKKPLPLEDTIIEKIMIEKVKSALGLLSENEQMIVKELFYNGTSIRVLSENMSVPKSTLHEQKDKIMKKLKKIIDKI